MQDLYHAIINSVITLSNVYVKAETAHPRVFNLKNNKKFSASSEIDTQEHIKVTRLHVRLKRY